jgi:hypothetical protein
MVKFILELLPLGPELTGLQLLGGRGKFEEYVGRKLHVASCTDLYLVVPKLEDLDCMF